MVDFYFSLKGQQLSISSLGNFRYGLGSQNLKYNRDGSNGSNNGNTSHVDINYPMFRLADVYLYAEASLRLGDQGTALQYVNFIRERAYGSSSNNFNSITLDEILDERSRELSWEAIRRTDLIRFGYFTSSNYLW